MPKKKKEVSEERLLHTDHEGYEVRVLSFRKEGTKEKKLTPEVVTYTRFEGSKYKYLTPEEAAERILKGRSEEKIKDCYIKKLSIGAFENVKVENKEDKFVKNGTIKIKD
ncbi:hypothetical protein KY317_02075, partial [Candidatus Woesearchaeota archaeon]|nr:hypothetical protein [Candidatus Woesearchaeota archaeon]